MFHLAFSKSSRFEYKFVLQVYPCTTSSLCHAPVKVTDIRKLRQLKLKLRVCQQPGWYNFTLIYTHGKLKKTQLREESIGWLHPWTQPAFRCQTQWTEGHSTFELGHLHLDTSISNGWAVAAARVMSNSSKSRWKLTEQTVSRDRINLMLYTQTSNTTSMTQRQETLIRTKPCHRIHQEKLKVTFSSWPTNRRTILKDWHALMSLARHCTASPSSRENPRWRW